MHNKLSTCIFFLLFAVSTAKLFAQPVTSIIPQPVNMVLQSGEFPVNAKTIIVTKGKGAKEAARFLNDYLQSTQGFTCKVSEAPKGKLSKNGINIFRFTTSKVWHLPGAYELQADNKKVNLSADNEAGLFYAVQSLIQLLPLDKTNFPIIPAVEIRDEPRFEYRGMHLDVSRHFFPISFIKKYIDYIAFHKMNYFHWHLTDDQGWRIEIKKYPRLTSVGAWRDSTLIGHYKDFPVQYEHEKYGGFYTQEQIKEVVKYAAERFVTVLPEIEMPGHSMSALAAYPWLSTTPNIPKPVASTWGINDRFNNVFIPTDSTFKFLEDVLTETMALFPSKYIHIGGDECSKRWWKENAFCQQLMKEKGLKDEHALQSYFIQRIEKFVNSKGRQIIGWDEILEGGLAPNALVMSWQGEEGGIAAAKQKHQVVMTPGQYVYLDHFQSQNPNDSLAIGGFTSLEKIYNYEPIPPQLTAEEGKYILGTQGNVWTEYMAYPSKVEYMIFPRMSALAEVCWSPKDKRDLDDFTQRLQPLLKRYQKWGAHFSLSHFDLQVKVMPAQNDEGIKVEIARAHALPGSFICVQGFEKKSEVMRVADWAKDPSGKFSKDTTVVVDSKCYEETENVVHLFPKADADTVSAYVSFAPLNKNSRSTPQINNWDFVFNFSKSSGKKIALKEPPHKNYSTGGAFSLVNGLWGNESRYSPADWLGWSGKDMEAVIALDKLDTLHKIVLGVYESNNSWIYPPNAVSVYTSTDGIKFELIETKKVAWPNEVPVRKIEFTLANKMAKFVKVIATNFGKIPEANPGGGKPAWLFVDEIAVY